MNWKKWRTGAVLFTAIAVLAACGSTTKEKKATGATKEKVATEQKINVSLPVELTTLDTTQTTDKITFTVVQHLFEGLYRLDKDSKPVPGLAESVDISKDNLTYTFKLKSNAKWSNGETITADDFVYAWKKLVNPASGAPNAYLLDNVKNSKEIRLGNKDVDELGVSAVSKNEFKVELSQAQPSFLTLISIGWLAPQNQAYVEEQGDKYGQDSEHLLYSGPFTLSNWKQGEDTWTLKKNKEYYDAKKVKLTEVNGSTVKEENTGINLFSTDKLDLQKISGQFVAQYADDENLISYSDIANYFLDFNKKAGTPLANVHLRKAIAYAINKEALANNVLNDGSKSLNGLIPKNLYTNTETDQDFREYSGDYLKYNQKKAKEEWQKAQKELGSSLELTLLAADDDNGKKVSEYVQSQIEDTLDGVKISIQNQPKNNVNQSRKDKDYEISLSGWIAGDNDLSMYFILYESGSAYNYGGYSNKEYDQLTEAAKTVDASDVAKQFEDYKQAEKILIEEDAAQVPLYQSASNYLINHKIKGIEYHLYGDYFNLRSAYLTK